MEEVILCQAKKDAPIVHIKADDYIRVTTNTGGSETLEIPLKNCEFTATCKIICFEGED